MWTRVYILGADREPAFGEYENVFSYSVLIWAYSFNGKTSVSKTEVPGSSPGGPANKKTPLGMFFCLRAHVALGGLRPGLENLVSIFSSVDEKKIHKVYPPECLRGVGTGGLRL